jgi:hypothetical protein
LCKMMEAYLSSQGGHTMKDCSWQQSRYIPIAISINNLGWLYGGRENTIHSDQGNTTNAATT